MSTIGEKIKKIREIKGLKQEDVAKSLGLSVNQYGKLERDESSITVERLGEIAKVLGVSIEEILSFDGQTIYIGNSHFNHFSSGASQHNTGLPEVERKLYEENKRLLEQRIEFLEGELEKYKNK